MPKLSELEKALGIELKAAALARENGDYSDAADAATLSVVTALRIAVTHHPLEEGIDFLIRSRVAEWLSSACDDYKKLFSAIERGENNPGEVGGNYLLVVLAQTAWLLGMTEPGETFVQWGRHPSITRLGTPFWNEYTRALEHLIQNTQYLALPVHSEDVERYWEPQLRLMSALSQGDDEVGQIFRECEEAFERQQKDRTLEPDSYGIDGNGKEPVRWSFRLESLRRRWCEGGRP